MAVDSEDNSIHTLLNNYILRVFNDGKMVRAVVGETTFVDFATRVADEYMLNNFLMHYCINGYTENGVDKEGYKAAARVAGILTAAAANESLTHYAISGASGLTETLTNAEIEYALNSGCLVFTQSTAGPIQIEYGINTLVVLSSDQDAGWKKIRRVSTRIELMKRITATTDPLIGKVDNDPDGRATLMAAAQGVVNDMAGEGKLLPGGTVVLDTQNPPEGDSAWFKVAVDDIDSAEKLYFAFGFKFAPTTA
jgi:hypothetical protein